MSGSLSSGCGFHAYALQIYGDAALGFPQRSGEVADSFSLISGAVAEHGEARNKMTGVDLRVVFQALADEQEVNPVKRATARAHDLACFARHRFPCDDPHDDDHVKYSTPGGALQIRALRCWAIAAETLTQHTHPDAAHWWREIVTLRSMFVRLAPSLGDVLRRVSAGHHDREASRLSMD